MEHDWYNESNKRERTLSSSFLQNRIHDRLTVLIPMSMRSATFRKFDIYPQAIVVLIALKVLLRRKYTFFNLTGYETYTTQIVTVPNLKSEF